MRVEELGSGVITVRVEELGWGTGESIIETSEGDIGRVKVWLFFVEGEVEGDVVCFLGSDGVEGLLGVDIEGDTGV